MTQNDKQTLLPLRTSTPLLLTLPVTAPAVGNASAAQHTLAATLLARFPTSLDPSGKAPCSLHAPPTGKDSSLSVKDFHAAYE